MKKVLPPKNVDEYLALFPGKRQNILKKLRQLVLKAAPGAEEQISYQMPAYKVNGKPLVYFAAYEKHIGFYAIPSAHQAFKKEFSVYKSGKGSVQFPLDQKIPYQLIQKVVKFRVREVTKKLK